MSDNQREVIALIQSLVGQANTLTIPKVFIDLTGDLKAAIFLAECLYWSSQTDSGIFYKTYQEWQDEIALSRHEIDRARKLVKRWVTTELRQANGVPVLHYRVDIETLLSDLEAMVNGVEVNHE